MAPARRKASSRSVGARRKSVELDPVSARLEFMIALTLLPPEAKETDRIAIAKRLGLDAGAVSRMFRKSQGAAEKALSRAKV